MVTGTTKEAINWSEAMTNNIERAQATQECDRPPGLHSAVTKATEAKKKRATVAHASWDS